MCYHRFLVHLQRQKMWCPSQQLKSRSSSFHQEREASVHWASRGRRTAARKPHNKKSQAHTTNGTRARGRWEPGQKPRLSTGPVPEISGVVVSRVAEARRLYS
jgi:hypothetical protein